MTTTKIIWNEALAAYDHDLDVLEATRHEYGRFIEHTLKRTTDLVNARLKEPTTFKILLDDEEVGPHPYLAEGRLLGPLSIAGLVVQIIPSSSCGGTPGAFLACLYLDRSAPIGREIDIAALEAQLQERSRELDGEPYDVRKHGEDADESRTLRAATVDLGATDLPQQLAGHVIAYFKAAATMSDAVAEHTSDDPYRWARLRLLEVRASFPLPAASATGKLEWESGDGLNEWDGGRYLGIRRRAISKGENDDLWVCALPNGDVVFAGYGPFVKAPEQWRSLCAQGTGNTRTFKDGSGATLFDAATMKALAKGGRTAEFSDKVAALFQIFLDAPGMSR